MRLLFGQLLLLTTVCASSLGFSQQAQDFVIVTQTPNGPVIDPADNPQLPAPVQSAELLAVVDALSQFENFGTEIDTLIKLVSESEKISKLEPEIRDRIEIALLSWTKPLPASNPDANLAGYRALANLIPDNTSYSEKRDYYSEKVNAARLSVLKSFKTKTDEFSGVTWYTHRNVPRYADIRPYVSLYLGRKDREPPFLRFVLHYTTRNGWLFVSGARANIDGEIIPIPGEDWKRDNDSETWEWIDVPASDAYIKIARKIADSEKTVIRFNGQQYVDDYVVAADDKEMLRDALLAFEVMKADN